eukprot:scaffold2508_cov37-Phaeocystis_antarctica.AAC.3
MHNHGSQEADPINMHSNEASHISMHNHGNEADPIKQHQPHQQIKHISTRGYPRRGGARWLRQQRGELRQAGRRVLTRSFDTRSKASIDLAALAIKPGSSEPHT